MTPGAWCAAEDVAAHAFVAALDDAIEIRGPDGHHLQRVRRLRAGEHMTAADGEGTWRRYEIAAVEPGLLRLDARGEVRSEPRLVPEVALALALTKAGSLDTVVARCTELGVARITPVRTRHTVVKWETRQAERATERLRAIAREAAAQSRRARLPEIAAVARLSDFADRPDVVIADRGGRPAERLELPATGTWTVVVGPEGGLEAAELEAFGGAPRLSLGPHILKVDTAPVAAAALLLSRASEMFGEWQV